MLTNEKWHLSWYWWVLLTPVSASLCMHRSSWRTLTPLSGAISHFSCFLKKRFVIQHWNRILSWKETLIVAALFALGLCNCELFEAAELKNKTQSTLLAAGRCLQFLFSFLISTWPLCWLQFRNIFPGHLRIQTHQRRSTFVPCSFCRI